MRAAQQSTLCRESTQSFRIGFADQSVPQLEIHCALVHDGIARIGDDIVHSGELTGLRILEIEVGRPFIQARSWRKYRNLLQYVVRQVSEPLVDRLQIVGGRCRLVSRAILTRSIGLRMKV